MIVCEFCTLRKLDGECGVGLKIPSGMSCREFAPGMEMFCADPKDFVSSRQIIEMAAFFGIKGIELKKVKRMATGEDSARLQRLSAGVEYNEMSNSNSS
jgi:hypothetical protein